MGKNAQSPNMNNINQFNNNIAYKLYDLSKAIAEKTGDNYSGGILGGEFCYGQDFENEVFKMHPFCWCERDDCGYCSGIGAMPQLIRDVTGTKYSESERLPNFLYKPTGFKMWWYKYIGRGEETRGSLPPDWYEKCLGSLK